ARLLGSDPPLFHQGDAQASQGQIIGRKHPNDATSDDDHVGAAGEIRRGLDMAEWRGHPDFLAFARRIVRQALVRATLDSMAAQHFMLHPLGPAKLYSGLKI